MKKTSRLTLGGLALLTFVQTSVTGLFADPLVFKSATFADIGQAARGVSTEEVDIYPELRLPAGGQARFPAVIIAHPIGGYSEANEGWFAAEFRKAGFATLTYDSFKSRQWSSRTAGGDPRVNGSVLADAFAALKFLADQPDIDPQKIAVVGFSLGGDVAHMTAFERFRRAMAPDQRFAAHVSFYPGWTMGTRGGPAAYTGSPVLFLFGEKDELTPPDKVEAYFEYLDRTNTPRSIETVTYEGAYHAWTNPASPEPRLFQGYGSSRKCPTMLVGETPIRLLIAGQEQGFDPALWKLCQNESRGYSMGFSPEARAKSLTDATAFLRKSMKL